MHTRLLPLLKISANDKYKKGQVANTLKPDWFFESDHYKKILNFLFQAFLNKMQNINLHHLTRQKHKQRIMH